MIEEFDRPENLQTEPGESGGRRFQRIRLDNKAHINIWEEQDGERRVTLATYTHDVVARSIGNYGTGSGADLRLIRKRP